MQLFQDVLSFFVSNAYAAGSAADAGQESNGLQLVIMTLVFIFFMYFVMWRPQSKRAKEHRNLINAIAKGDEVVTSGGILGRVANVSDHYVGLALTDSVEITVQKSSITNMLPKGTLKSIK